MRAPRPGGAAATEAARPGAARSRTPRGGPSFSSHGASRRGPSDLAGLSDGPPRARGRLLSLARPRRRRRRPTRLCAWRMPRRAAAQARPAPRTRRPRPVALKNPSRPPMQWRDRPRADPERRPPRW